MFLLDYHTHTKFSFDGTHTLVQMAEAARERGISELCFTDHCDFVSGKSAVLDIEGCYNAYQSAKEQVKGISLLFGIEAGESCQNPENYREILSKHRFDFIIGSLHIMKGEQDFFYMKYTDETEAHKLLEKYWEELLSFTETEFDVLGHLTYPLRYMCGREGLKIDIATYEEHIRAIFRKLISLGKGIELNVSGLNTAWKNTMPALEQLKWYKECGGEIITVGTDAHTFETVGKSISSGFELLKQVGFSAVSRFNGRRVSFEKI